MEPFTGGPAGPPHSDPPQHALQESYRHKKNARLPFDSAPAKSLGPARTARLVARR